MPRIKASQMTGNYLVDNAWCPGCGLHAHVHGEHSATCTRGHHGHVHNEPCTDRCDPDARARRQSPTVMHSVDNADP